MAGRLVLATFALFVASCAPSGVSPGSPSASAVATIASSPEPTPSVISSAPASTATSNLALLKSNFGVIYWGAATDWAPGSAPQILPEGRTTKVGELAGSYFNQFHGTVSPDGRRAIYAAQPDRLGPWAYYLVDGAKPTEQRRLLALPNEQLGPVLWSADMSAIAFTAQDAGATQGVIPKYDSIRIVELTTGAVRELARITDGSYYQLVGWDKAAGMLVAQINPYPSDGTKKSTYLIIGPSGTKTTPVDGPSAQTASPDGRTVVGLLCVSRTTCSLWTWPLGDYSARVDQHLPAGLSLGVIGFRPGTSDLGLTVFEANFTTGRIALWSLSAGLRTLYPFPPNGSPAGPPFFRADGSAVIVDLGNSGPTVIDILTGQSTRLPLSSSQTSYSHPGASIRLD